MNKINNPVNGAQIRFNDTLDRIKNGVLNLEKFDCPSTPDGSQIERCETLLNLLENGKNIFVCFDKNTMMITEETCNSIKQASLGFRTGDVKIMVNAGKIAIVEGDNDNKYFILKLI